MTNIRTVSALGREISYTLTRKNVKNLNLRVARDGSVHVSVPRQVSASQADAFVASRAAFIASARQRMAARAASVPNPPQYTDGEELYILGETYTLHLLQGRRNTAARAGAAICLTVRDPQDVSLRQKIMERFLQREAQVLLQQVLDDMWLRIAPCGVVKPALRVRRMVSRWGSCMVQKGVVTLNTRLLEYPRGCAEFVAMHELCHLVQPNHSPAFYTLLTACLPAWRARQAVLRGVNP